LAETFVDPAQEGFLTALRRRADTEIGIPAAGGAARGEELAGSLSTQARELITGATGTDAIDAQLGVLSDRIARDRDVGLNQIASRFGVAGTAGSRAGVTGGQLFEESQRALASGTADILDRGANRNLSGASLLPGVFNLGISGFRGAAEPLAALAQLIGDPTLLSRAQSEQRSSGASEGTRISFFGG
jgi:hypothetical protein